MAIPSEKSSGMTEMLEILFERSTKIGKNICVICNMDAKKFRDELSEKEYTISGMCQSCQNKIFDGKE